MYVAPARGNDKSDKGPTMAYHLYQSESVHRTGHLDVGENHLNVAAGFQDANGFIRIRGTDGIESCLLDHVLSHQADEELVLHDKHNRTSVGKRSTHLVTIGSNAFPERALLRLCSNADIALGFL